MEQLIIHMEHMQKDKMYTYGKIQMERMNMYLEKDMMEHQHKQLQQKMEYQQIQQLVEKQVVEDLVVLGTADLVEQALQEQVIQVDLVVVVAIDM